MPPPPPRRPRADDAIEPTIISSRTELNLPNNADPDQTIVSTPGGRRAGTARRSVGPSEASQKKVPPAMPAGWKASHLALGAAMLVVLVGGAVLIGMFISSWTTAPPQRLVLTVLKPVNGTIVGDGINCGTKGTDCMISVANDAPVALRLLADDGFAPGGYTGDCPASGQFLMTASRTCGASFVAVAQAGSPKAVLYTLTIFAIGGGVVRVGGMECREKREGCAEQFNAGEAVDLDYLADKGYTFERFTGACDADGRVTMTEPKTCGARFVSQITTVVPPPPNRPQPPAQTKTGVGGAGTVPTKPLEPAAGGTSAASSGTAGGAGTGSAQTGVPAGPPGAAGAQSGNAGSTLAVAGPPPPPPAPDEMEEAKKEIGDLLERYRRANEARDFAALRSVYPTASDGIAKQWKAIKSLKLDKAGEPEVKVDLSTSTATAIVPWNRIEVNTRDGKTQGSRKVTLQLHRKTPDNRWVIGTAKFES